MDFFTTYYTYNFIIPPISYDNILDYNTLFDVYNEKLIFDLRDYIITYDINEGKIVTNSQLPDVSQSKLLLINNEDFIESPNAILDAKQNTKYDTIYYSPNVSNKQIVFVHNGQVDNLSKIKENIETKKLKLKNYNALKTYLKYHFLKDIEIKKTNKEIVFNKYWIGSPFFST